VKRLSCDGSVLSIVENEAGEPLTVGRKQRTVSTAMKRALWSRPLDEKRAARFQGALTRDLSMLTT
jgi:hypothetical protein